MIGAAKISTGKDWRWILGVLTLSYAVLIWGASLVSPHFSRPLLQGLGVPALEHPFMDLRGVAAWCDAWQRGNDPAVVETSIIFPGEAKGHPNFLMNYSPLVLGLGKLGLSATSIFGWEIALALIYAAALWVLCGPCTRRQAFLWAMLLCSPASVLVAERGNLDMLIFALLVSAMVLRRHSLAESGVILAAALLKFYPILALTALWKERARGGRLFALLAFLFFGVFLILIRSRLASIGGSLTGQYQSSFGSSVLADLMLHYGGVPRSGAVHFIGMGLRSVAALGIAGAFVLGLIVSRTRHILISERALHAFFLGTPLLLALFVQGPQMDYKWIFFLLLVPAVLELTRSPHPLEARWAKIWLCLITAYSYWTFFSDEGSLRNALLKQLLMWGVIFLTAFLSARLWSHSRNS